VGINQSTPRFHLDVSGIANASTIRTNEVLLMQSNAWFASTITVGTRNIPYYTSNASVQSTISVLTLAARTPNIPNYEIGAPLALGRLFLLNSGAAFSSLSTANIAATNTNAGMEINTSQLTIQGGPFPSYRLVVNGAINATIAVFSNGTALQSDRRIKTDIQDADIFTCYSTVKTLPLRYFSFLPEYSKDKVDKHQLGFIAQEVENYFPKSILTFDTPDSAVRDIKHINMDQMHFAHYGATKFLISTVESQQTTIRNLMSTVESLQRLSL
jgi:hypothetical protein